MSPLRRRLLGAGFLLAAVLLWEIASGRMGARAAVFPPPSAVGATLLAMVVDGRIVEPLATTLYRLAAGYGVGLACAIGLGVAMGHWDAVRRLFEPLVELLRPVPKAALVPPLMFFLGLGDAMTITVIALGVFFPVLINTIQGVRGLEPEFLETARTYGVGTSAMLRKIVVPATLPQILAGMQIGLGIGFVLVIIAEMLTADGGIGFAVLNTERSFRVKEMYAWVLVLAATGYALNGFFVVVRKRVLHWRQDYEALQRAAEQQA